MVDSTWMNTLGISKAGVVATLVTQAVIMQAFAQPAPPEVFKINCMPCHLLDQTLVGPSLVEISEIYPEKNKADFIKWTMNPGKKREQLVQMPAMTHVPEKDLAEIFDYIKKVTVGVTRIRSPRNDPFAANITQTRRPRIERTFVPHAGPASIIVALPSDKKHNLIWDTDQCRVRYISEGEPDRWPYLRSNGNALAKVGDISYMEKMPLFKSGNVQFKGYQVSKQGYPSFLYKVDEVAVTEKITLKNGLIVRTLQAMPHLPEFIRLKNQGEKFETSVSVSGNTLTIIHRPL